MRGGPPSLSSVPLPPIPTDPETQSQIKKAVGELGVLLLRQLVPQEAQRAVGAPPLLQLLRGPPHWVLLSLRQLFLRQFGEVCMTEISLLQQLADSSSTSPLLRLLLALLLEELPRCSTTYKYRALGALEPTDLLCLPGVL
ncbi:hypothetical protein ETH_00038665, partial [Eimeria tenella]